ncbi:MAG TPA: aminoglycoside 6-adenylyltransferase [Chitinophagaceae bacterium]|nr:aminoglycoside 6-adenylyltransferase [Chitinophagaceae bacterium]
MRAEQEIKDTIIQFAERDERVRAVLLNGSRADPNSRPDKFSDFDVVFVVNKLKSFTSNHVWISFLGDTIISQRPDEMSIGKDKDDKSLKKFSYLLLLHDRNRVDLTLLPRIKISYMPNQDSLSVVWLDKDGLFKNLPSPANKDYYIKRPRRKEFLDVCNEFWWVSTYVAKGLARDEITYAKEMLEKVVRPMLMKMIEWKIGSENKFSVQFGTAGKYMKRYLPKKLYKKILRTYSGADIKENWKALMLMTKIFSKLSNEVAANLQFLINDAERKNVTAYLKKVRHEYK